MKWGLLFMNSTLNFRSYSAEVDFEGIKIHLPNIYRYVTRDKFGFIQAWQNKPKKGENDYGDGSEMPITLGHQIGDVSMVMRKYRRKRNKSLISLFGIMETFG